MYKKQQDIVVLSLLSAVTSALACGAEGSRGVTGTAKSTTRSSVEFASSRLVSNVDLPHLPMYTGVHKFDTGTVFPNAEGGASYCIKLLAREYCPDILEWYATSLKQYGWKPMPSLKSERSVGAIRKGLIVHICVRPASGQFRSSIFIQYKLGKSGGGD